MIDITRYSRQSEMECMRWEIDLLTIARFWQARSKKIDSVNRATTVALNTSDEILKEPGPAKGRDEAHRRAGNIG